MKTFACFAIAAALAAVGAIAAQEPPRSRAQPQHQQDAQKRDRADENVTGKEVAELMNRVRHPIEQCIRTAEQDCGGKTVMVVCCSDKRTPGERTQTGQRQPGQQPGQPGQQPGQSGQQPGQNQPADAPTQGATAVWKVTCLTEGDRLVEVTVDATNGRILGKRNVPSISLASAR